MNDNTPQSNDQFVTDKVTRPAVVIDCSDWVETSEGWTFGNFVTEKITRDAIEVVCTHSAALAPVSDEPELTVSVQFEDGDLSDSFVTAIRQSDPTVRLEREPSAVLLALPNQGAVAALFGAFQGLQAAGCVIGSDRGAFRVRRAAS
jgi:hypothetical protein